VVGGLIGAPLGAVVTTLARCTSFVGEYW